LQRQIIIIRPALDIRDLRNNNHLRGERWKKSFKNPVLRGRENPHHRPPGVDSIDEARHP